jgi:hypothetical protein
MALTNLGKSSGDALAAAEVNRLLYEDDNGRFGMGIATPTRLLQLHEPTSAEALVKFSNSTTGSTVTDGFELGLGADEAASINQRENNYLQIATNNTERLRITSTGQLSTGAETAPDCSPGGITLQQSTSVAPLITGKGNVTHGLTQLAETDTWFVVRRTSTGGGVGLQAYTDSNYSVNYATLYFIAAQNITADTTTSTAGQGIVSTRVFQHDNANNLSAVADAGNLWVLRNNDVSKIIMKGDGSIYQMGGKISTGAEASPDCSPGGITLQQGASNGNVITCKSSEVAHGLTSVAETDTYTLLDRRYDDGGGLGIACITDGGETASISFRLAAYLRNTADTTASSASVGVLTFRGIQHDGSNNTSSIADAGNMAVFRNDASTKIIFKGDGDIYTDTDQTSGLAGTFDAHNDLELCDALRYGITGWDAKVFKKNKALLENLGILKNGFLSDRKSKALLLGAVGQIGNMIRGLADKLGIEQEELLQMAKTYN